MVRSWRSCLVGEAADLLGDVHAFRLRHVAELLDLRFQLCDRFFEIKEVAHLLGYRVGVGGAAGQRVVLLDQMLQPLRQDMRVNLGRRNVGMA